MGSLRAPMQIDREAVLAGVVQADAAEIHRQLVLEPRHHHLEDAAQVLAFADARA